MTETTYVPGAAPAAIKPDVPPTAPPTAPVEEDNPGLGIAHLVFGLSIFTVQDVIVKILSSGYPVHELVFVRGLVALPLLLVFIMREGGLARLRAKRPVGLVCRGVFGFLCYTLFYMALSVLPVADAVTLFYASPLFVTALSVPILKEAVGLRRWMAVLVGFLGVAVVMRPGLDGVSPAMLLAVGSAFAYALVVLITRKLSRHEAGSTMAFYMMLVFFVVSAGSGALIGDGALLAALAPDAGGFGDSADDAMAFLLRAWVVPDWIDLAMMSATGVIGAVGFYSLTQAYRVAPAATVAPFEYSSLPLAVFWGFVIFGDLPDAIGWLGIALVIASGLYIIRREGVRGRRLVVGRRAWRFRP